MFYKHLLFFVLVLDYASKRFDFQTLVQLLSTYSLKDAEEASLQCLQRLAELSKLEAETFTTLDFDDTV